MNEMEREHCSQLLNETTRKHLPKPIGKKNHLKGKEQFSPQKKFIALQTMANILGRLLLLHLKVSRASVKPGTWNIAEHPATFRNIQIISISCSGMFHVSGFIDVQFSDFGKKSNTFNSS